LTGSKQRRRGSVYAWVRKGGRRRQAGGGIVVNMTPVERSYRLGCRPGPVAEILNTDAAIYGGGNRGNLGGVTHGSRRMARAGAIGACHGCRRLSASICMQKD
jgi:1,4-alpha-glucan branching enzyme